MKRLLQMTVAASVIALGATAAVKAETVLKLGHYYSVEDFRGKTAHKFADLVKEKTNGEVTVQVFPNESLVKGREGFQSVAQGVIDMYHTSNVYFAGQVPLVNIFALPFPPAGFDDDALYRFNADTRVKGIFAERMAKANVINLGTVNSTGDAHMYFRTPVRTLEDMQGKMVRVGGGYADRAMQLVGASVASLSAAEQFLALQTGTVDGIGTTHSSYVRFRLNEVAPYHLEVSFLRVPYWIIMNKRKWDSLSSEVQARINEAIDGTQAWSKEHFNAEQSKLLEQVRESAKENIVISPEEQARWEARMEPLQALFIKDNGEAAKKLLEIMGGYSRK